jgi:hypothetical protein
MIHPLKLWLRAQSPRKTLRSFAKDIGVHDITLRRMMNGDPSTSREIFEKVEAATRRELSATELYRLHLEARRTSGDLVTAG